jgi:hypothetical protein
MRLRKQDADGDMQFGHGAADFWFNQVEGVGQSIMTRLLLFSGEWFLDNQEGTPWGGYPINDAVVEQGQILGVHTALSRDVAIRERVIGTTGVLSLDNYDSSFDPDQRYFSVGMTVTTVYGRLTISVDPSLNQPGFTLNWSVLSGRDPL